MVTEPRYFYIRRADVLIPAESNMYESLWQDEIHLCGVKEPIMLHIAIIQSTGESLCSPYQPKGNNA